MWIPAECLTTSLELASRLREDDFIFEEKFDGIRAICEVRAGGNIVTGRTGSDITKPQSNFLRSARFLPQLFGVVFDGELMPDGRYIIFDVLHLGNVNQATRKAWLFTVGSLPSGITVIRSHTTFAGVGDFVEGVVVKDLRAKYGHGWWKAKRVETDDLEVVSVDHETGTAVVGVGKVSGVPASVRVGDCIEVEFFKRFDSGKLRNGRFVRLRDDKQAHSSHDDGCGEIPTHVGRSICQQQ